MAVDKPGHGGHIKRPCTDTAATLKEEPRGAGAFLFSLFCCRRENDGLPDEGTEALHVGHGGIVGGLLSGAGVCHDL